MTQSGYTPCKCPDCMEIAISNDVTKPDYCNACEGVCGPMFSTSSECQAPGAYGACTHENTTTDARDGTEWCDDCGENSHGREDGVQRPREDEGATR